MATIGLDKLFYATITEDENGNETYGIPKQPNCPSNWQKLRCMPTTELPRLLRNLRPEHSPSVWMISARLRHLL